MDHHASAPRPAAPPSSGAVVFVYIDSWGRPRHLRARGCPDPALARQMLCDLLETDDVRIQ